MRISQFLLATLKETPADAEVTSHQLMLRAGMIRKNASGIYTWLPLGLRALRKVQAIVREELDRVGALEILMPAIQPAELWQETLRWEEYGNELLKIRDRHERDFCFGPTHEEVVTEIMRNELRSYKQLPMTVYQIQTKFRDEIRPRFGVMRGREFQMKDAYSFHIDQASLDETYQVMYNTYIRIFTRLGLNFRPVWAITGSIGGSYSHEFQALADAGEDEILYSKTTDYAANVEIIERDGKPDDVGELVSARGIEVGQVFQLGDKYSKTMGLTVLNEKGEAFHPLMGCYGIGISRSVAASIEQHHDDRGIIWPKALAPFDVTLLPMNLHKSYRVREASEKLYNELKGTGFDVLFDDRRERAGVMFAEADLIGIPHRLVISEKGIDNGTVEYKARKKDEIHHIKYDEIIATLKGSDPA